MTLFSWSKTAGSNDSADATINWSEGQTPSTVNNSARAMMAATAKYRDDMSGSVTTGGTSTAYTVTSNQVFTSLALMAGKAIVFVPHTTSGATVTLNVDGLGAKPLRTAPGIELISGQLVQGTPYAASYNNSDAVFYLYGVMNLPSALPIGAIVPYSAATAPSSSYALCFGQAISRSTYVTLFGLVSTTYGIGDGSTTFNIPDLRGRIIAGQDNMGGSAASRITSLATDSGTIVGATIGSTGGSQSHQQVSAEVGSHSHTATSTDSGHTHPVRTSNALVGAGGTFNYMDGVGIQPLQNTNSGTANVSTTVNANAAATAMALLQPTIIMPYIIRVL